MKSALKKKSSFGILPQTPVGLFPDDDENDEDDERWDGEEQDLNVQTANSVASMRPQSKVSFRLPTSQSELSAGEEVEEVSVMLSLRVTIVFRG